MKQLISSVKELQIHIEPIINHVKDETATINSLVLPLIEVLGYDIRDPREVCLEYVADIRGKKGEKVDIAILDSEKPILLIECKSVTGELCSKDTDQLYRYFAAMDSKFGVLTNGLQYRFYSDLDEPNRMDESPFMEINLLEDTPEKIAKNLVTFSKSEFDQRIALDFAEKIKYTKAIKQLLSKQLEEPSTDFVSFIRRQVCKNPGTKTVKDSFVSIVRDGLHEFVDDHRPIKPPPPPEGWISLAKFTFDGYTKTDSEQPRRPLPPPSILFWDGKERKPKYWKELLKVTVELLYADGSLTVNQLPYKAHPNRHIVHTDYHHPSGREFTDKYQLPNTEIYVEADWGARNVVKHCRTILVGSGKNPETDMLLRR